MNKGNSSDDCLPKFFKVYLPDESGDDLKIPISFTSFVPKPFPKTVTVRSISGSSWELAFRKCSGDVESFVLVNGWKRIAKDEYLKGGDFLEFEFDGFRHFNFCIYERETMCKRVRSCSEQSQEVKVESESEEETRATDDVLAPDEEDEEDDDDDDDDDDEDDSDYDSDAALEEEDNDGDKSDDYVVDDAVSEDGDDDDDVEDVNLGDDAAGDDRHLLDDPENPSFTLRLNPKKQSQLLIPAQVIKDYGLHFPESITIVDPLAKKFGTLEKQIKIQTNGTVFVKGFGSIIRRNNVKTTDKVICEIMKTGDSNLVQTMKIHILSE
ncbi:PREDICTED: B3 domain-containing protein At5g60130-like [Camelina sativa]|uniref:B3 domain-containing protein At5g60130-like n=1 Tax=Camelina sativa TaxID=90675 RepID=A0ABM0UNM5_CAMSA|nr:PREDICTED: B3 domain-containing protein At5g60130-like [Camelina sativa]